MITRFPGMAPTRSRASMAGNLIYTAGVSAEPVPATIYEESLKALARIDESLALCGADKTNILMVNVFLESLDHKKEFDRAWSEWVDMAGPPTRAVVGAALTPPYRVELVAVAVK